MLERFADVVYVLGVVTGLLFFLILFGDFFTAIICFLIFAATGWAIRYILTGQTNIIAPWLKNFFLKNSRN